MRIGLAYNQKPDPANSAAEPSSTNDAFAEWDDPSTIAAVEQALGLLGEVYVGLDVGGDPKMLGDGARISKTQSAVVLEKLIGQFLFDKAAAGAGK